MKLLFIPFILVVLGVLWLLNYSVFKAVASFFGGGRMILYVFLLLTVGFALAMTLGSIYSNSFTRILYLISASWIGILVYLFLASCIYGIIVLFGNFGISESYIRIAGVVLFSVALVASAYGLVHSKRISVNNIVVHIDSLPQSWSNRNIVFISDLHLGQINGQDFSRNIVKKINDMDPGLVLIGGDMFDGATVGAATAVVPFRDLSSKFGTYFVTGNHEGFGGQDYFLEVLKAVNIKPLQNEVVEVDGLQIVGVDYSSASNKKAFKIILESLQIDARKPSILMLHEPRYIETSASLGISLQLSGHTHRAQMWPLSYIPKLIYRGFGYGLNESGLMKVYTSSGVGTWGPPMRVLTDPEIVLIRLEEKVD